MLDYRSLSFDKSHIYITLQIFRIIPPPLIFSHAKDESSMKLNQTSFSPFLQPDRIHPKNALVSKTKEEEEKKNIPLHDLWRQNLDKYPPLVYTPRKNASGIDARIRDIERRGVDSCGSGGQERGRERLNASRRIEGKEGGRKEENGGESKLAR